MKRVGNILVKGNEWEKVAPLICLRAEMLNSQPLGQIHTAGLLVSWIRTYFQWWEEQ